MTRLNPDFRVFPEATLRTERLLLRPYAASDAAGVHRAVQDPAIQRWLPLPTPYTLDVAVAWCTSLAPAIREHGDGIEWAAEELDGGGFVGSFGLKRTDWRSKVTEIGYWVAPWARDRGLATEAVATIGRWALLGQGFERMELRAATGNVASQRVAERAGLLREGTARNAGFTNDGRVDLVIFSLTRGDLSAR